MKKLFAVALFFCVAALVFAAAPANWKFYVPGSINPNDPKADMEAFGWTLTPNFENHVTFVDNTTNGKKALKLDTRDNKPEAFMIPVSENLNRVTFLFKARGSLIPDNGTTPFGILWACWQRNNWQAVLRHNQTNQIKGSDGQTNLKTADGKPDDIVSDWHDFRLVFETADEAGKAITATCYIDGVQRHQTKKYMKKTVDIKKAGYQSDTITGNGHYFLFGENDGSTNGFARYSYFLLIENDDVSGMSLEEIGKKVGADLVTKPVTVNDPQPISLKPAQKPAGINMKPSDGIPEVAADWVDPSEIKDGRIDLNCLPYSKAKAVTINASPKFPLKAKQLKTALIVSQDGSGAYKSVAEAVQAAKPGDTIYIKPGFYCEKLVITTPGLKLVGENPATTVIYGYEADFGNIDGNLLVEVNLLEKKADGTVGAGKSAVAVPGASFSAENITFYNKGAEWNATWKSAERRSIALCLKGVTEGVLKNCMFFGQQDTMYLRSGRVYFENCYIEGEVDFICGGATCLFQNCQIYSVYYKNGGYITATAPGDTALADNETSPYAKGYIFRDCIVNGDDRINDKKVYLGRGAWVGGSSGGAQTAKTVYIRCKLGKHLEDEGWRNWDSTNTIEKAFFREYGSTGEGALLAETKTRKFLTSAELKEYDAKADSLLGFKTKIKY